MNKPYLLIVVLLILLIPIGVEVYNNELVKKQIDIGYDLLEEYSWHNTQFINSSEILISEVDIKTYPNLRHGLSASQKIKLDYSGLTNLKVDLLVYKLNKQYDGRQLYAHALVNDRVVIGAYIITEFTNNNQDYYFSLADVELKQPIN